jgi:ketosteroid isomerase-like protein
MEDIMRLRVYGLILVLLFSSVSLYPGGQKEKGDVDKLRQTIAAFYDAVNTGNADKRAEMFTSGAMLLPNHWTAIKGKQAVGEVVKSGKDMVFRIKDLQRLELSVSGDIGYTVNEYYYTYHRKGEEPDWKKTKNVHIWRKQADGTWKLHVDIWNSSTPLPRNR